MSSGTLAKRVVDAVPSRYSVSPSDCLRESHDGRMSIDSMCVDVILTLLL